MSLHAPCGTTFIELCLNDSLTWKDVMDETYVWETEASGSFSSRLSPLEETCAESRMPIKHFHWVKRSGSRACI